MDNNLTAETRVSWCWYSVRHNSLHAPITANPPNWIQRVFMCAFGFVAISI